MSKSPEQVFTRETVYLSLATLTYLAFLRQGKWISRSLTDGHALSAVLRGDEIFISFARSPDASPSAQLTQRLQLLAPAARNNRVITPFPSRREWTARGHVCTRTVIRIKSGTGQLLRRAAIQYRRQSLASRGPKRAIH